MAFWRFQTSKESPWWMHFLRGMLAVLFGFFIVAFPNMGLAALVFLFGAYTIIDGASALLLGLPGRFDLAIAGILSILMGITAFARPLLTATALVYAIAIWAILLGTAQIFGSFGSGDGGRTDWFTALAGLAALALGGITLVNPAGGLLSILAFAGAYAMASGIVFIFLGFNLQGRRTKREPDRLARA